MRLSRFLIINLQSAGINHLGSNRTRFCRKQENRGIKIHHDLSGVARNGSSPGLSLTFQMYAIKHPAASNGVLTALL